ncbi:MAG: glycosyltransferase family 2 protein [Deltaproteobacteria bacterium]|nr:glycosyltransferase family 2 protein [Deltaproteobacteria bacterium]
MSNGSTSAGSPAPSRNGSAPHAAPRAPEEGAPLAPAPVAGHRVAALVPALDCARTIADVVRGAAQHCEHVLVVDDGSTDATARLAQAAGAEVIRHEANRGKGAALRSGLVRLLAEGFTHAFSVDGDGQHLSSEMQGMIDASRSAPDALVLGARRIAPEQEVAPIKRFGNDFANWWVSLAAGRDFRDTQTGFRIYPIAAILNLGVQAERYEFESEVLILAARRGIGIETRGVAVFYPPPAERISHYDPWLDTCRIIVTVVSFLVRLRT